MNTNYTIQPSTHQLTEQETYDLWEGRAATLRLLVSLREKVNDALDAVEMGMEGDAIALLNEARTQINIQLFT
jgi:hypothetical protein